MTPERMRRLRRLSTVPRWTTVPMTRRQNVAEHSFHVAWIALELANYNKAVKYGELELSDLLTLALFHDESEAVSGDIATPFKRNWGGDAIKDMEQEYGMGHHYKTLDHQARVIIKLADLIEAFIWLNEEKALGNKLLKPIRDQIGSNIRRTMEDFDFDGATCLHDVIALIIGPKNMIKHPSMEYPGEN